MSKHNQRGNQRDNQPSSMAELQSLGVVRDMDENSNFSFAIDTHGNPVKDMTKTLLAISADALRLGVSPAATFVARDKNDSYYFWVGVYENNKSKDEVTEAFRDEMTNGSMDVEEYWYLSEAYMLNVQASSEQTHSEARNKVDAQVADLLKGKTSVSSHPDRKDVLLILRCSPKGFEQTCWGITDLGNSKAITPSPLSSFAVRFDECPKIFTRFGMLLAPDEIVKEIHEKVEQIHRQFRATGEAQDLMQTVLKTDAVRNEKGQILKEQIEKGVYQPSDVGYAECLEYLFGISESGLEKIMRGNFFRQATIPVPSKYHEETEKKVEEEVEEERQTDFDDALRQIFGDNDEK